MSSRTCRFRFTSNGVMASIMPGGGCCFASGDERQPRMSVMPSAASMSRVAEMEAEAAIAREIMKEEVLASLVFSRMKIDGCSTCRSNAMLGPKGVSKRALLFFSSFILTSFSSFISFFLTSFCITSFSLRAGSFGMITSSVTTLRTTALAMSTMSYSHAVGTTFSSPTATLTLMSATSSSRSAPKSSRCSSPFGL